MNSNKMNSPKRKVTDLLPSEAIRVSPNQDGRVFDIEPIPTEAEKVEVFDKQSNDSIIATFIRSQIDWYESNHDYQIATDTIRCWLDEFLQQQKTRNTPNQ